MEKCETNVNVDAELVWDIIYNTSRGRINQYDAIKSMHAFLNSSNNEQEKKELYKKFVIAFAKLCSQHFSAVIHKCVSEIQADKTEGRVLRNFLRKILNDPIFIDTIRCYEIKGHPLLLFGVDSLEKLFNNDTIITLLRHKMSRACFLALGCHPALLNHIDLQKKWIQYYVGSSNMPFYIRKWYVTDEAINKLPREVQLVFALMFAVHFAPYRKNKLAFSLDTIKRILLSEIVVNGKKQHIEYAINRIQDIQTKYLHYS